VDGREIRRTSGKESKGMMDRREGRKEKERKGQKERSRREGKDRKEGEGKRKIMME
jgi:hypothetical protein